jgi:hypothetical protein
VGREILLSLLITLLATFITWIASQILLHVRKRFIQKTQLKQWDSVLNGQAKKIWDELEHIWRSSQADAVADLQKFQKFLEPLSGEQLRGIPVLCSLIRIGEENILILPSFDSTGESPEDIEGIGRTGIMLELIGIHLPYARIMGLEPAEVIDAVPELLKYFKYHTSQYKLLVSDMAFLTLDKDGLRIVPLRGEKVAFAWDLARHIFRLSQLEYKRGLHRCPGEPRDLLCNIFKTIRISDLSPIYGDIFRTAGYHTIDRVFVIKRLVDDYQEPIIRLIDKSEKLLLFKKSLRVPLKHGSEFWRTIDFKSFEKNIDIICFYAKKSILSLPIYEITYRWPTLTVPLFVYQNIASLIKNPKTIATESKRDIHILKGISQHNALVLDRISTASNIAFVARSHEKLLRDPAFWKALMVATKNRKVQALFVLLDPDEADKNPVLQITYSDKWKGFLAEEIKSNLQAITRLAKIIPNLELKTYLTKTDPLFRVTLINDSLLIFAGYQHGVRTNEMTRFFKITADDDERILYAFKRYLEKVVEQASPPKS